ncbi:hypothetical protein [Cupriavidus laharis]|uniref:hypothetical protein n=1 Tax=Cupriavidus laharis TaxID=151654 RepID=UPI001CC42892|nr:hypothetical protein [Cupriavidus laharis]
MSFMMPETVRLAVDTPDHTTPARKAPKLAGLRLTPFAWAPARWRSAIRRGWVSPNAPFHWLLEQFMLEVPGRQYRRDLMPDRTKMQPAFGPAARTHCRS